MIICVLFGVVRLVSAGGPEPPTNWSWRNASDEELARRILESEPWRPPIPTGLLDQAEAREAIARLDRLASKGDSTLRARCLGVAGRLHKERLLAEPFVLRLIGDEVADVRRAAAYASYCLRLDSKQIIEALIGHIDDPDLSVLSMVLNDLRTIGPRARASVKMMVVAAHQSSGERRRWLVESAVALDPEEPTLLLLLRSMLGGSDVEQKYWAFWSIPINDAAFAILSSDLVVLLGDSNWSVRREACKVLGAMGRRAQGFIPQVAKMLTDEDRFVRATAASALDAIRK